MAGRIVVVGPINVDLFVRGSAPTDPDVLREWVDTCQVDLLAAGSVGYTCEALSSLGAEIELHTTLGTDAFGAGLRATLAERGYDLTHVDEQAGDTGIGLYLLLFGGTKRPLVIRYPTVQPWPDPPAVDLSSEPPPRAVLAGGLLHFPEMYHRGLGALFAGARARGVPTALDPQFPLSPTDPPWLPHLDDVLPHTDVLCCDEGEAAAIFGTADPAEAVAVAVGFGCRLVAIKRGAEGAIVGDGRVLVEQPAVPVPQSSVEESVGAGDAFDAGLLTAFLDGAAVQDATRYATATAAVTLSGRGGSGTVRRDSVQRMLDLVPEPRMTVLS